MMKINKILFPTDFSRCADQALEHAVFLAEKFDAEIHVLHAVTLFNDQPEFVNDEFEETEEMIKKLGTKLQLVGDDIFVTNPKIFRKGISEKIGNAILVKVNQIGSLSETLEVLEVAGKNQYKAIISHRSGETEDTTIAHLAVASGCGQIKTGSLSRTDRICKYNELLRIEEELGKKAAYAGCSF